MFAHDYNFDPTYGHTLDTLLAIEAPKAPEGFDDWWMARYQLALDVTPHPALSQPRVENGLLIQDLVYTSTSGVSIGGWLTQPAEGPVTRGLVVGHGYGGRDGIEDGLDLPGLAVLYYCCRGMSRSKVAGISDHAGAHVLCGIDKKDTYVIGGCVEDTWCACSALLELFPQVAGRVGYRGGSFGGGIGALSLPWDNRFTFGELTVPTFGHHPSRLTQPCAGSGEAVRQYVIERPEIIEQVLPFYDAATAASRIRQAMHVAPALFDPVVPPPGQFAVCNALSGPKTQVVQQAGHFTWDGGAAEGAAYFASFVDFMDDLTS